MPDTVKNPVSDVYKRWSAEVKKVVGDGNYSFERRDISLQCFPMENNI